MQKNNTKAIYNATIDNVLANVPDNEIDLLKTSYQEYLSDRYDDLDISDKLTSFYAETENTKWLSMSLEDKKGYLIRDENFSRLRELSGKAKILARARIKEGSLITPEEAADIVMNMENYYEQVEDYNKVLADQYLSEGSVDCYFASNQSDNTSIRLSSERQEPKLK